MYVEVWAVQTVVHKLVNRCQLLGLAVRFFVDVVIRSWEVHDVLVGGATILEKSPRGIVADRLLLACQHYENRFIQLFGVQLKVLETLHHAAYHSTAYRVSMPLTIPKILP